MYLSVNGKTSNLPSIWFKFSTLFNTSSILIPLARQVKIAGARLKTLNSPNYGLKTV